MFAVLNSIGIGLYSWIMLLFISFVVIAGIIASARLRNGTDTSDIYKKIAMAGYAYEPEQDIFCSTMDAWQRNMGYCRLYDEALAPLSLILDCEPIYFEYDEKRWLIELWKGQYGLCSGCEIGVYTTEGPDLNIPGVLNGTFYNCVSDEDRLHMYFCLEKQGEIFFTREDTHWWLTGFKLGDFSEPSELTMDISITLKDEKMCDAFIKGLENAGYSQNEVIINGNTVSLKFAETRTPQPITRTPKTDALTQIKNKLLCDEFQDITGPYDNFPDKIKAIQEKSPEILKQIINIGRTVKLFEISDEIKKHINISESS